ncbi:MAG: hypothetical protein ABFE16_18275 [Armatimonadia bacterium]
MLSTLLSLLMAVSLALASPQATVSSGRLTLRNDLVERVLVQRDGVWRTQSLSRADGSDVVQTTSDEVLIRLMDGTELTLADYTFVDEPEIAVNSSHAEVSLRYRPRGVLPAGAPQELILRYWVDNTPYLRKTVACVMPPDGAVDELQVERFRTETPGDRGGRGEPVFLGSAWFVGLEYPGSQTAVTDGLVTLAHFPGLAHRDAAGRWLVVSKTAIAGVGQPGDPLELAFSDYLNSLRRPPRNFLHYNSWYDWRGDQLSVANLVATYDAYRANLLEPYGLKMDAFVPDDGWQDYASIWAPRKNLYPEGFRPLKEALEARGTRFGIWMPLNGTNLNTDWGAQNGFEKSDRGRFYCLVGQKYNAAFREATRKIIQQGNCAYYKHDFNTLRCTAAGHGHLPDDRHGHEANLDAELDLLAYERQLQPDIFLNVTSSVWMSPWWLVHADSIWMGSSDTGYDKSWPMLSPREWEMSYRDAHLYNLYHVQRRLVPVSAMMTHGITHGRYNRLGGPQETLREWSDHIVMYYGRGVQLKELYITPEMVPQDWWQPLGETTRWAVDRSPVLEKALMVGGDPKKGEVYGYVHWLGDRGILCLRNPGLQDQGVEIPFDKSVAYRGASGRSFRGRVVYPYIEDLPTTFTSGKPITLSVSGASVMLVELEPGLAPAIQPACVPALEGAVGQISTDTNGKAAVTVQFTVPDEDMQRCDLYLIARGAGSAFAFDRITLDQTPVKPRRAGGTDWALYSLDLSGSRGKAIEVVATLPGRGTQPFSEPEVTLSAWFVADRPVSGGDLKTAAPANSKPLPFAVSQGFRRQTLQIVPDTRLSRSQPQGSLTAADLATLKAGKLRLRVFGANSEPEYRDKFIYLNGEKLLPVPPNKGELDAWQEVVLDLKPDQLRLLKLENTLRLDNAGGDCYKFGAVALAVQLANGTWVQSSTEGRVYCSVEGWAYSEGQSFRNGTSGDLKLNFAAR